MRDEYELARSRRDGRRPVDDPDIARGAPAFVGQVVSSGGSIALNHFLLVSPTTIFGAECQACPGTLTVDVTTIPVLLIGTYLPVTGDYLICRFVDYRWVAEKGQPTSTACPATIHVQDRGTGAPIPGVPITLTASTTGGTLPSVTSGVTDSSGNWTLPSIACASSTRVQATVTYGGVSYTIAGLCDSSAYCGNPIKLCYCTGSVAITTMSGSLVLIGTTPNVLMTITGGTSPSGTAGNQRVTAGSGTVTAKYSELILCASASAFPIGVSVKSNPQGLSTTLPGYLDNCAELAMSCGDSLTMNLPLYYWPTCYIQSPCAADPGCDSAVTSGTPNPPGTGNPGPNNRALTPKNIQIRWVTNSTGAGDRVGNNMGGTGTAGGSLFASDEGSWVTVPWVGLVGGKPTWDTGCRGAMGNTLGCPSATLNGTVAGDTAMAYSGTRIVITDCYGQCFQGGSWSATYIRYGDACPSTNVGGAHSCPNPTTGRWAGCQTGVSSSTLNNCLVSPLDQSAIASNTNGTTWSVEIREVACASVDPTPPVDGS